MEHSTSRESQDQSIWKLLPAHPQPQWLEALSSYVVRLAEANGLKSLNELAVLARMREWTHVRKAPDYSPFPVRRLAGIARCGSTTLQGMTFFHLSRHFARFPHLVTDALDFFQGSVAPTLRYCPLCLAEKPYYRLCWRFLAIAGCAKHHCSLLSACGHCRTLVPLLPRRIPRIAVCTTCRGDLRTCLAPVLPSQAYKPLQQRTRDLELLLMPTEWGPEIMPALIQGSSFVFLRQRKHLSVTEIARLMEREEQVIEEIEVGNWNGKATLADYWQYTALLDSSLSDVLEAAQIINSSKHEEKRSRLEELALLVRTEDLCRSSSELLQAKLPHVEPLQEKIEPIRPLRRERSRPMRRRTGVLPSSAQQSSPFTHQ